MQRAQQHRTWDEQPSMAGTLLKQFGEGWHATSQVLAQRLEFGKSSAGRLAAGASVHRIVEAMVDVVVDQLALGVGDGIFDSVQLLGEFQAWLPASIMPIRSADVPRRASGADDLGGLARCIGIS
jgi:hypothetical protein